MFLIGVMEHVDSTTQSTEVSKFYHWLDMVREDDPSIGKSAIRQTFVRWCKYRPWLRSLALTQLDGTIIMHKRQDQSPSEDGSGI